MKGKGIASIAKVLFATGLVVGGILAGAACTSEKKVEVTREVPVTVEVPVTTEVPMNLARTAAAILAGEIDVGAEYGLGPGQRYHTIHTQVLGLACATCHQMGSLDTAQVVFTAQDVSSAAPGPVDKRPCLGCHNATGPAHELYQ